MNSYASLLLQDYGAKVGEEGTGFLGRIVSSAQRLDRLITDILSYSRLTRGKLPIEAVDTEKLTRDIVESYPTLQEPNATVSIEGRLPIVSGNMAALTQVISNLLTNAVKFVAPGVKPRIEVSAQKVGENRVRIWFADNGIGIAEEASGRIFQIFQRLNAESQYEGTGIGLSIVRKAVERMQGEVGVESEVGKGSRFWIELPGDAR
jgi:signal transduction histidine kinase